MSPSPAASIGAGGATPLPRRCPTRCGTASARSPTPRQGAQRAAGGGDAVAPTSKPRPLKENLPLEPAKEVPDAIGVAKAAATATLAAATRQRLSTGGSGTGEQRRGRGAQAHQPFLAQLAGGGAQGSGARAKAAASSLQVFVDDDFAGDGAPPVTEEVRPPLQVPAPVPAQRPALQLLREPRAASAQRVPSPDRLQQQMRELEQLQQQLRQPQASSRQPQQQPKQRHGSASDEAATACPEPGARRPQAGAEPPEACSSAPECTARGSAVVDAVPAEPPWGEVLDDIATAHTTAALLLRHRLAALRELRAAWAAGDASGSLDALQARAVARWPAAEVRRAAERLEQQRPTAQRQQLLEALWELGAGAEEAGRGVDT